MGANSWRKLKWQVRSWRGNARRVTEGGVHTRSITADTDLRLCRFFGLSNGYWLRVQAAYDTEIAEDALQDQLKNIRPWNSGSKPAREPGVKFFADPR